MHNKALLSDKFAADRGVMHHEAAMKEYIPAIAAIIAGTFAIISAFIAWKLKNSSDTARENSDRIQRKHEEAKLLYTGTFQLFEEALRQVLDRSEFTLAKQFNENNAIITEKYSEVADFLESWSKLHAKTNLRQIKVGDQEMTMIQSPDPTVQYKETAKAEYDKLQVALQQLVELMRDELDANA